jgi:hypothetical protein
MTGSVVSTFYIKPNPGDPFLVIGHSPPPPYKVHNGPKTVSGHHLGTTVHLAARGKGVGQGQHG